MEEALLKRVLPHSIEAEKSVLGSMMINRDAIVSAIEIISANDFYSKQNGIIFECITEIYNNVEDIDLVILQNKLNEKDVAPQVSSIEYLKDIVLSVPTSTNIKSYATIVKEKSTLRSLIKINEDIADTCYAGKEELSFILEKTEKDIFGLLQQKGNSEFTPISVVAENVFEMIDKASRTNETVTGVPTGFFDLDFKTSGFQASDLVLIAARPSMGKTAFVLNVVQHISMKKQLPCIVFSLEMSKEQLVNRLIAMETGIDSQKLRTGKLNDNDWETLVHGVTGVGESSLIIDDTPGISLNELRSKCRKMKLEKGLSIIIIDYLQLMSGSGKSSENRQQEISAISRGLKALAREMQAPVIALSQLSRACETRPDHRPMLSDLRESGAIEQDADIVMFLYRDDYYHKDTEHPNEAEVIIAKQRNGPIGTVNLLWKPELTKFLNIDRGQY